MDHPATSADTPAVRLVDGVALVERRPKAASKLPVVLVHGGMHGAWCWNAIQDWLTHRGYRSVAFDWLSHGHSRTLPREEWLRRGLLEVACEIEVACASVADAGVPPVVMGHSMGGLAALAYAAAGHALSALVLLTPVVPKPFGDEPIGLPVNASEPFGPFPPDMARELFFDGVEAEQAAAYAARLQAESPAAVWQATRWTAEVDVSKIKVPTFVVAAERDRLVPSPYVAALASAMHARLLVLPGVGHGVELNPGWEGLLAEIVSWIEALT